MPRDSSGAYTLPSGNPVVDGTIIESTWANPTMSDIAVQLNNVFTRDGLLGPIAPVLFVNGTIPLPGIAFQESPSTGLMRTPPATLNMVINGVVRQQWTAAGGTIQGPIGIVGDLNVTGIINSSGVGPVNIPGPLYVGNGTAALPAYSFINDNGTGLYLIAGGTIGFSAVGALRMTLTADGSLQLAAPTNPAAPVISFIVAAGGFGVDMRGRASDQLSVLRFLTNDYTTQLMSVQANNAVGIIGTTAAIPFQIFTANVARINIGINGNITVTAPTSGIHVINGSTQVFGSIEAVGGNMVANNFYVGSVPTAAGTFGLAAGVGAAIVTWGNTSPGGGQLDLVAGGIKQASVLPLAGAINWWAFQGSIAGSRISQLAQGGSADIGLQWTAKGAGDHLFLAGGPGGVMLQLTAGGTGWIQIAGAAGAAPNWPKISSNVTKITIEPAVRFMGTNSTIGDIATLYSQLYNFGLTFVNPGQPANRKIAELIFVPPGSGFQARFLNDAGNDARTIFAAFGGVDVGVTDFNIYTGQNDVTLRCISAGAGGGRGWVSIGNNSPLAQLHVNGLGSADPSGNVFDPNVTPALMQATLFLADKGAAAGNGGAILFAGFSDTVPGVHFASIKAYITDASGRTAGELRFNLKNTSADTGSTQVLHLTANRSILDSRDLPLARDGGLNTTAPNFPVGTFIVGQIPGFNLTGLNTVNAAVNNITLNGMGSGGNVLINFGTWRTIGALSSTSNTSLFIRIA